MKKLYGALLVVVSALVAAAVASADPPAPTTFVAVLNAAEEVPLCGPADESARGLAIFHVRDDGTVEFKIVANNLPGFIVAAHIHVAPAGVPGPVVQPTPPTPGEENGVVAEGSFVNPFLVAALQADPTGYYVNVHTDVCPAGVIRGQLGTHGPPGTAE